MAAPASADPAFLLREHGLRVTAQRRAILDVLDREDGHLSAEQVYDQAALRLPELARATVYNVLGEFVRAGLLRTVEGRGPVLYDRNLDDEHHHFHCLACGQLFDVYPRGASDLGVEAAGFEIGRTEILFEGRCADCVKAGNAPSDRDPGA